MKKILSIIVSICLLISVITAMSLNASANTLWSSTGADNSAFNIVNDSTNCKSSVSGYPNVFVPYSSEDSLSFYMYQSTNTESDPGVIDASLISKEKVGVTAGEDYTVAFSYSTNWNYYYVKNAKVSVALRSSSATGNNIIQSIGSFDVNNNTDYVKTVCSTTFKANADGYISFEFTGSLVGPIYNLFLTDFSVVSGAQVVSTTSSTSSTTSTSSTSTTTATAAIGATGATQAITSIGGSSSGSVIGDYNPSAQIDVYNVDIQWGDLDYDYNAATEVWNPETHSWDATEEASWLLKEGSSDTITVTNNSSCDVNIGFSFENSSDCPDVTGVFTNNDDTDTRTINQLTDGMNTNMTAATSTSVDTFVAKFAPAGDLPSDHTDGSSIGNVVVTLSDPV